MDHRLETIVMHDSIHGCTQHRGTGTAIIEAKLAQQLAHLEQAPFYRVFIDLKKAFDAMDRERCLEILGMHGVGPNMMRLICNFWDTAINVCRARGNYGQPFQAGRGVTQGGPLSAKLFNILVDAVAREWKRLMRETLDFGDAGEEQKEAMLGELFAIFYVDDGYIASRDPEFLQKALDMLVEIFRRTGLKTNTKKTQAMVCTPGKIRVQLSRTSYRRMREGKGGIEGDKWEKRSVVCQQCGKAMQNKNLRQHLAGVHDIYNCKSVVEENCFNRSAGVEHRAVQGKGKKGKIQCPVPECPGELGTPWMLRRHFRDVHPEDTVYIPWEGGPHPRCGQCRMQCNPAYPKHAQTKTCKVSRERREQREKAMDACLSLCQMF